MTNLATFVEESGMSVVAVVHLKRPPNGLSFNQGRQISLNDLRGSAAIEQLSHNVIAIEGDQQGADPNKRYLRLLKCREWGDLGLCQALDYVPETGRYIACDGFNEVGGLDNVG
jgi:twinkle protein